MEQYDSIINNIVRHISSERFTYDKPDHSDYYSQKIIENMDSASIMDPSPGVSSYDINILRQAGKVTFSLKVTPNQHLLDVVDHYRDNPIVLTHRSRVNSLASNIKKLAELEHRVNRSIEYRDQVKDLIMPNNISHEIASIYFTNMLKYLEFSEEYIHKYTSERRMSSIYPGVKWGNLRGHESSFRPVFEEIKGFIETWQDREGKYMVNPLYGGIRQRSNTKYEVDKYEYQDIIERSRWINWKESFSLWNLFIRQKRKFYTDTINDIIDLFDLSFEFISPIKDGGYVYIRHCEEIEKGHKQKAFDAVSWDVFVGTIAGASWSWCMMPIRGSLQLGSGISATSWLGTICSLWLIKDIRADTVSILGDDINIYNTSANSLPLTEREHDDEDLNFLLGVRYDNEELKLCGIKFTRDVGKHMLGIKLPNDREQNYHMDRELDERVSKAWRDMYIQGTVGGKSLRTLIKSFEYDDYWAPTEGIIQWSEQHVRGEEYEQMDKEDKE